MNIFPPYFWGSGFNPPIPTQFDEALSYQQQLQKIYEKVIEAFTYMQQELDGFEKETYDKILADVQKQLSALRTELKESITAVEKRMTSIEERTELLNTQMIDFVDNLQNQINTLRSEAVATSTRQDELEESFISFKTFVENRYSQLEEKLTNEILDAVATSNGDAIIVTNPSTERRDTLKKTLQDIYDTRERYAITVQEFNNLKITAKEFNDLNILVKDFNEQGALILLNWWARQADRDNLLEQIQELKTVDVRLKTEIDAVDERVSEIETTQKTLISTGKNNYDIDNKLRYVRINATTSELVIEDEGLNDGVYYVLAFNMGGGITRTQAPFYGSTIELPFVASRGGGFEGLISVQNGQTNIYYYHQENYEFNNSVIISLIKLGV